MDKKQVDEALAAIPGAIRAKNGFIVPGENGELFHVTDVYGKKTTDGLTAEEHFYLKCCSRKEILRLRELKNSHDYLLRIRANSISDSARAVRVIAQRRRVFERNREWSLTQYYHGKDRYHKTYIGYLERSHQKQLKAIPAGLALIKDANAVCIRSFLGDVVLVSEALEWFYYYMILAIYGNQLGISTQDRISAALIGVRIMSESESLDFDLDSRGELPDEVERELQQLVFGQMQFTFGHEYAHALRGHLPLPEVETSKTMCVESETSRLAVKLYSHEIEYEADLYSIKHIRSNRGAASRVARGAINAFLALHLYEEVQSLLELPRLSVSDSHPRTLDRLWRLWAKTGELCSLGERHVQEAIDVCVQLRNWVGLAVGQNARGDLLTFYGSIYLPSYRQKRLRDRIDF